MLKSFPEDHPTIFNAAIIGIPSLLIFLLIFITDPFEFSTLELANRLIVYVMLFVFICRITSWRFDQMVGVSFCLIGY